ncbi:helix-turn-helix transcriptional regulator [Sphingopyxis alaskensis]|jgi:predicted DNA-binding transcriptional regulator YafY|uniref:Helix-turn-helix, type 11 n=1 Tax=Sphingopyxis alaskensis (strain DSM 13593 / LMG 18877 / RB2256) TaxID=317655 RepID=Q1GQJ5_SPHAL|nr:YafY family protein [Sphingopyxis alaskensis]ABF54077.1 Helix-turn-helix, type 11 [Sphingopyxis alaskensis RB2256]MCM3418847.1 YafY family transcriptional regulator [Sphingopyxis alaskensis]
MADKTGRLFAIIDSLRRRRRPVTAEMLAEEQGVSVRTLYRDIQALIALGAPIEGAAGVGYMLRPGFFLPPLMFTAEELEALVLGARWVEGRQDGSLSRAAGLALAKIAAASPDELKQRIDEAGLWPVSSRWRESDAPLLATVRAAMRSERTLHIDYADEQGRTSERAIWPAALAYFEEKQVIAAWCLLRQDFRSFRIDRIAAARIGDEGFGRRRAVLMADWWRQKGWDDAS